MMRTIALTLIALWLTVQPAAAQSERIPTVIVGIVDGDTIVADIDGRWTSVRLIGIDTPETRHPRLRVQCFGREASARTRELALGKPAELEMDVQQRDRYRRLLAYVWIDGEMLNWRLAAEGYAWRSRSRRTYATPTTSGQLPLQRASRVRVVGGVLARRLVMELAEA